MMNVDEAEYGVFGVNTPKIKFGKTLYQQQMQYRAYLSEAKGSKEFAKQVKDLLEL